MKNKSENMAPFFWSIFCVFLVFDIIPDAILAIGSFCLVARWTFASWQRKEYLAFFVNVTGLGILLFAIATGK